MVTVKIPRIFLPVGAYSPDDWTFGMVPALIRRKRSIAIQRFSDFNGCV